MDVSVKAKLEPLRNKLGRLVDRGWLRKLPDGRLTTRDPKVVAQAAVHLQWDPERSVRGAPLNHYSIQVGLGRHLIRTFSEDWVVSLTDLTPQVHKAAILVRSGRAAQARLLLPTERVYPTSRSMEENLSPMSVTAEQADLSL
ncbi:DUF4291 family protein [Streptomyces sp. NPDC087219]|uniref:DUF4291 family protein n=1 Tax=Streptomyces sp. NPDC087219 TaxID=3365770 RepID=UPI0038057652